MSGIFPYVASVTIPKYLRQETDATTRRYKMLAQLQAKGNMTFNNGGTQVEWPVKFQQNQMRPYADQAGLSFNPVNRHKRAIVDYGQYVTTESISRMALQQNQGEQALVKLYADKAEMLIKEMKEQFHTQLYVDGNASGNEDCIDGFETYFGISGAAAAGFIGSPSSTYAGLSCVLGAEGGSWSTNGSGQVTWPRGKGSVQYDYWSPIVALVDGTGWATPTATFAARGPEVIRFCLTHAQRNQSMEGMVDSVFLNLEWWRLYKELTAGKERIIVNRGDSASLVSLGFTDVMSLDGAEITGEYGIADDVGYGLNFDEMELMSMASDLFQYIGPDWSIKDDAWLMLLAFNGQLRTNTPRNQFKIRLAP